MYIYYTLLLTGLFDIVLLFDKRKEKYMHLFLFYISK